MRSEYIRLVESHCRNCLRCVRACPTNAMTYLRNAPQINDEECILCGRCYTACPHDAKSTKSDLRKVRQWLAAGDEVILSCAPSFVVLWKDLGILKEFLIRRGFSGVEETVRGAALVSRAYMNLIRENKMENIISTCCPAVNSMIEKEYPDLIGQMAPVVSPLIAHGRLLRQTHPDARIVFLSPCIAKYREIEDERFAGAVDACLSMEEVLDWIRDDLQPDEYEVWDEFEGSICRAYPTAGGIISTLEESDDYEYIAVDGIMRIRDMLEEIRAGGLKKCFLEVNACRGSCIAGPLLAHFTKQEIAGERRIMRQKKGKNTVGPGELPVSLDARWRDDHIYRPVHSEEEIQAQMAAMGKTTPMRIHDCGACGYETCRLKAIAVLDGKADPKICLPDALERAQSLSDVVLDFTPNGIIIVDEDNQVREMNTSARKMLGFDSVSPAGLPLEAILPNEDLMELIRKRRRKNSHFHCYYEQYDKLYEHAIVPIPSQSLTVIILMDRTNEILQEVQMASMRSQTIEVTQQVINEQMQAVQEIASMLGETTARSKVALLRLQKVINGESE